MKYFGLSFKIAYRLEKVLVGAKIFGLFEAQKYRIVSSSVLSMVLSGVGNCNGDGSRNGHSAGNDVDSVSDGNTVIGSRSGIGKCASIDDIEIEKVEECIR
jgi:hypothetical protein